MAINVNFVKKYAAEKVLKQIMNYLEKDPEKNFLKILDLADKVAITETHHGYVKSIREGYKTNPAIRGYVKKFTELADSYKYGLIMNFFVNAGLIGIPCQRKMAEKLGYSIPWAILFDPTSSCNLQCKGCWAGKYKKGDSLAPETIDRFITEAKQLGTYFMVISGGEPTCYPYLFDILKKHKDVGFCMFTNGTLIDDKFADKMLEVGNLTPAFSLEGYRESTDARRGEGTFDKVMAAMDRLKERGIAFGTSLTATSQNVEELFAKDDFVDFMIEKGAIYTWIFHYIPIGRKPDLDMMLTPEQRYWLADRIPELRNKKTLFLMDFWNDGTFAGGCVAGGRRYLHINAKGEVEPCAFVHFACDNIKEKSLKEVLQNPLFKAYQKRQPFNKNLMLPCPIIDNPQALRDMVKESKAFPTHDGAETVLTGEVGEYLDNLSERWGEVSKPIFERRMGNGKNDKGKKKEA